MSTISTYALTFNCARVSIDPAILSTHLFSSLPPRSPAPEILILCLQELSPIAYSFLGGSYLVPYLSPFRHAVSLAGAALDNASYVNIITRNVGMTAIMVFVLRDQTSQVRWLETGGAGVGVHEMGNKGAVGVRMGWSIGDETLDLCFVSAHLAPMEDALQRRNEDWKNIVRGLVFTPVSPTTVRKSATHHLPQEPSSTDNQPLLSPTGEAEEAVSDSIPPMTGIYHPTTHLLLAGDLNYRTSSTPPPENAYLTWPQPTKTPSAPEHYSHLLPHDQLTPERLAARTLHGLSEAPIDFPPTYKYSEKARRNASVSKASEEYWDWSKHRRPSWCDRILYLDMPPWMKQSHERIQIHGYNALPLMATSDHRAVACSFIIPALPIPVPPQGEEQEEVEVERDVRLAPPFALDPLWREKRTRARMKEVVVGIASLLVLTWEGRGILIAVVFGAVGGWAVVGGLVR